MSAEVICISSDDEEPGPQHNGTVKQNCKTIKPSEDIKREVKKSVSPTERVAVQTEKDNRISIPKRKESQETSNNINSPPIKRLKVCEKLDIRSSMEEERVLSRYSNERELPDTILRKPLLVVKEKRSVSPMDQHPFPMFISLCLQKDRADDMQNIVNKLKRTFERLDEEYMKSEAFKNFLNDKRNAMMQDKKNKYIYILDVINEMRDRIHGASSLLSGNKNSDTHDEENEEDCEDEETQKRNIKIARIDKAMKKCEKYIKKLEAAEVDFEEEDDSTYIKLERYKRRMVELYNVRCRVTGDSIDAGRSYLRPKRLKPTGITAIDEAITQIVNAKIFKRNKLKKIGNAVDALVFPNYSDILQCIQKCNNSQSLGFNSIKLENMAKTAFTQLGEHLQRVRLNDYWDTFSLYLEHQEEDPAAKDLALSTKLSESQREGQKRLANIFQKYVDEQEKRNEENNGDEASHDEKEQDEEEEESEGEESGDVSEDEEKEKETLSEDEAEEKETLSSNRNSSEQREIAECVEEPNSECNKTEDAKKNANVIESAKKDSSPVSTKEPLESLKRNSNSNVVKEMPQKTQTVIKKATVIIPTKRCNTSDNLTLDALTSCNTSLSSAVPLSSSMVLTVPHSGSEDENIPDGETDGLEKIAQVEVIAGEDAQDSINKVVHAEELEMCDIMEKGDEEQESENEENAGNIREEKPLLRLRSFAKPPTTWKDGEQKCDRSPELTKTNSSRKVDIVDLTQSPSPVANKTVVTTERVPIKSFRIVKTINNNEPLSNGKTIKILQPSNVTVMNQVLGTNGSSVRVTKSLAGAKVINVVTTNRNAHQNQWPAGRKRIPAQNITVLHPTTSSSKSTAKTK